MKRLAVFTVMLVASMLLSSCLSFSQATLNPGATATSSVPNTEQSSGTIVSNTVPAGTQSGGTGFNGTAVGTFVPLVPNTGEFEMEGTPEPLGTSVLSEDGQVFPYAGTPFPGLGTSAAGTPQITNENGLSTTVPDTGTGSTGTTAQDVLVRLTQLRSYSFGDSGGSNLGQVTDFVINLPEARISYVVLNSNNRSTLVPWSAVSFNGSNGFSFSGSTDQLNSAPQFDQSGTDFNNQTWDQNYQQFWGGSTAATQTPGNTQSSSGANQRASILASQLLQVQVVAPGFNSAGTVQNGTAVPSNGNNLVLGTVQDALVSQTSGQIPWLLVGMNTSFLNLSNRVIPVPFAVVGGNLDVNGLLLTLNQNLLTLAPNLDASNLPNLFGSGWDQQFFNFWNNSGLNNFNFNNNNQSGTAQP